MSQGSWVGAGWWSWWLWGWELRWDGVGEVVDPLVGDNNAAVANDGEV